MDGGAWWATVHGVAKSWTWLSHFIFTFHFRALEKEMATHSSVLAWRIPGMGEPGGLQSVGLHRVGHNWSDLAAAANCNLKAKQLSHHISFRYTTQWVKIFIDNTPFNSKESACSEGDLHSIPGWGRSPGEGHGNPLQYSCLENPMDRGTWSVIANRVAKCRTWLKQFHVHTLFYSIGLCVCFCVSTRGYTELASSGI